MSADQFLRKWVPRILGSSAYKKDGLLVITFDEGGYTLTPGVNGRVIVTFKGESCCGQLPGPNAGDFPHRSDGLQILGPGGERIGAVLLSPFIQPGRTSSIPYNHYSLLKSLEDIFDLRPYLGYARQSTVSSFGLDVTGDDSSASIRIKAR